MTKSTAKCAAGRPVVKSLTISRPLSGPGRWQLVYKLNESCGGDDYKERPKMLRSLQAVGRDRPLKLNRSTVGRHTKRPLNHSRQSLFHKGV